MAAITSPHHSLKDPEAVMSKDRRRWMSQLRQREQIHLSLFVLFSLSELADAHPH